MNDKVFEGFNFFKGFFNSPLIYRERVEFFCYIELHCNGQYRRKITKMLEHFQFFLL